MLRLAGAAHIVRGIEQGGRSAHVACCASLIACQTRGYAEAALDALSGAGAAREPLDVLQAEVRVDSGKRAAAKMRKAGRLPACLHGLAGNGVWLLSLNLKEVERAVRLHGRSGLQSRVFNLQVGEDMFPGLPRLVHVNATTRAVENISFLHCPPERRVQVDVPVRVVGEDACPGIKQGGFPSILRKKLPIFARGDNIPGHIEVDITGLKIGQRITLPQMQPLAGVEAVSQDDVTPVVKITGSRRLETAAE